MTPDDKTMNDLSDDQRTPTGARVQPDDYAARLEQLKADLLAIVEGGMHGECAICEVAPILEKHFNIKTDTIESRAEPED